MLQLVLLRHQQVLALSLGLCAHCSWTMKKSFFGKGSIGCSISKKEKIHSCQFAFAKHFNVHLLKLHTETFHKMYVRYILALNTKLVHCCFLKERYILLEPYLMVQIYSLIIIIVKSHLREIFFLILSK